MGFPRGGKRAAPAFPHPQKKAAIAYLFSHGVNAAGTAAPAFIKDAITMKRNTRWHWIGYFLIAVLLIFLGFVAYIEIFQGGLHGWLLRN